MPPCHVTAARHESALPPLAGLVTILVAKAFGAASITVTDMVDANLALASRMGATCTLLVDPAAPPAEAAASLKATFGGEGPDIVIDCAGFESTMQVLTSSGPSTLPWRCCSSVLEGMPVCFSPHFDWHMRAASLSSTHPV